MNNLVKQQGCAGSGVTDFTPIVRILSERRVKIPESLPLKRRPQINHLYFPFHPSCPPPPKPWHSNFIVAPPSSAHNTVFVFVNSHYHLSGCRDFCPGKAILQNIKHFASSLNAICEKRMKLFWRRECQDKQITGKRESLPCITISSVKQLCGHPISSDTQMMQVHGS